MYLWLTDQANMAMKRYTDNSYGKSGNIGKERTMFYLSLT